MRQLTRKRMKEKYPLWKREPGSVWRDVGNLRLCCKWIDHGEYSATIFDTEMQQFLFIENCDVVSYAMGMSLLDGKVKKFLPETVENTKA